MTETIEAQSEAEGSGSFQNNNFKYIDDKYDSGDKYAKSERANERKNVLAIQGNQGEVESQDERRGVTETDECVAIDMTFGGTKNPFYGKHHTEETKKKLSEARIGKHYPKLSMAKLGLSHPITCHCPFCKAKRGENIPWNKGRINCYSAETLQRMSKARKGKRLSDEHKRKLSETHRGNVPWNCGQINCYTEETRRKMSETKKRIGSPWNIGRHPNEETCRKMSEAHKGAKHYLFGKHLSDETKRKLSEVHKGKYPTMETRKKMSKAHMGNIPYIMTEEIRRKISEANKGKIGYWKGKHLPEGTKRKLSKWHTGKRLSNETRQKLSEAHKGTKHYNYGKHLSPEHKQKISQNKERAQKISVALKGRHLSEETKRKLSERHKGKRPTEETRRKMSEGHKGNKTIIETYKRGCFNRRPNNPEKKFIAICTTYNLPFKYVGDGKFWIENVNPDFIESNGKKLAVEIYGDYWHTTPKAIEKNRQRVATLEKYGWQLLVLWEHEINQLSEKEIIQIVRAGGC
jgi:hypothetical protein